MSTGSKFAKTAVLVLCLGSFCAANAAGPQHHRKAKKPQLPPLPAGPTGPIPQIPLDSIAPVPPQVSYENGQLTIVAPNSTLGDILRAVKKQTGAEIEVPSATDRVVAHLGPGPTREVMAQLLNGSRFNYVLLGSPSDIGVLTRVVLVAKSSGADRPSAGFVASQQGDQSFQPVSVAQTPEVPPDAEEVPDEAAADQNNVDQQPQSENEAAEEQQEVAPDQSAVKTPQQLLQEMQQRQLQMQQQQPPGQPPVPGPVTRPEQE